MSRKEVIHKRIPGYSETVSKKEVSMEFDNLLTLIKAVSDSELTEFQYEENGTTLRFVRETPKTELVLPMEGTPQNQNVQSVPSVLPQNTETRQAPEAAMDGNGEAREGKLIKSPLVGTFYAAPSEDAEPFVAVGDGVKKGKTLGIVEAMKLMNEIESEYEGTVTEILVENGQMVEYGQPLFRIK